MELIWTEHISRIGIAESNLRNLNTYGDATMDVTEFPTVTYHLSCKKLYKFVKALNSIITFRGDFLYDVISFNGHSDSNWDEVENFIKPV